MTFPCTVFSKWRMDIRPLSFFSSSPTPEASMDPFSPASRSFQIFCAPPILSFILLFVPPSLRFAISLIFVFIGSFSPVVFHCSSNIMARVAAPMFTLHMTPPFSLSLQTRAPSSRLISLFTISTLPPGSWPLLAHSPISLIWHLPSTSSTGRRLARLTASVSWEVMGRRWPAARVASRVTMGTTQHQTMLLPRICSRRHFPSNQEAAL